MLTIHNNVGVPFGCDQDAALGGDYVLDTLEEEAHEKLQTLSGEEMRRGGDEEMRRHSQVRK